MSNVFFFLGIEMQFTKKGKMFNQLTKNFELFLHMLLKFEINWARIDQVIR